MQTAIDRLVTLDGLIAAVALDREGLTVAAAGLDACIAELEVFGASLLAEDAAERDRDPLIGSRIRIVRTERNTIVAQRTRDLMLVVLGARDFDATPAGVGFHIEVALKVIGIRLRTRRASPPQQAVPIA